MKLLSPALALTAAAALATGSAFLLAPAPAVAAHHGAKAEVGQPAPAFTAMDQHGNPVSLADFKGDVTVVEFFNDQCPFVAKFYEPGVMQQMAADYAAKGVQWVAIDSSHFTSVEENASIAEAWGIDRAILDDSAGDIGHAYGAKTTPHMYVIDAEGVLRYAGAIDSVRSTDSDDIEGATNHVAEALDAILAGEEVQTETTKPYGCSVKYK
ncbi:thioredoxin family protein [Phycisphaera mikurensis]|uniref:Putative oxidoreductase n=1 Tax=Phycisphaera mikurensis (strain NBRC 102666 / KCTC 22515 / FYK2301M01) TaxID=1142394 RepID=I0IG27_PHYMF|nr:thioredoxin family protein [Phycisphaera mikurensis]MBB6440401.1 peroxiredoxin [Phycisphaera mikurensis]BAM04215.1 putative oxidoreductase [Phycisphaera mikurensis NBRC 102666]